MISRRRFVAAAITVSAFNSLPRAAAAALEPAQAAVTPEMFGAKGDGQTDDRAAFAALSKHVNTAGGGTVVMRATTYRIGSPAETVKGVQKANGTILHFFECSRAVVVRGNGACLQSAEGQKYGVFFQDGSPVPSKKSKGKKLVMRPYRDMVRAERCSGRVEISDLELDGSVTTLVIGGKRGDKGWQIAANGLSLNNNTGDEFVKNVDSHHHPLDGFYIDGLREPTPGVRRQLVGLKAEFNARQGMSIVGGRDYEITDSLFARTGRAGLYSAPGAGVDIEAEHGKKIRNLSFSNCKFEDNYGVGLLASTGDSADVKVSRCTLIGTTKDSAWPHKPGYRFIECLFVGCVVNAYGNGKASLATQFIDCKFRDDPKLSPTGHIYFRKHLIAQLPHAKNVLFDHCDFLLDHDGVLPWSIGPIYADCSMKQRSRRLAHTRGVFRGTNRIDGRVDIGKSKVKGTLVLNGKVIQR